MAGKKTTPRSESPLAALESAAAQAGPGRHVLANGYIVTIKRDPAFGDLTDTESETPNTEAPVDVQE